MSLLFLSLERLLFRRVLRLVISLACDVIVPQPWEVVLLHLIIRIPILLLLLLLLDILRILICFLVVIRISILLPLRLLLAVLRTLIRSLIIRSFVLGVLELTLTVRFPLITTPPILLFLGLGLITLVSVALILLLVIILLVVLLSNGKLLAELSSRMLVCIVTLLLRRVLCVLLCILLVIILIVVTTLLLLLTLVSRMLVLLGMLLWSLVVVPLLARLALVDRWRHVSFHIGLLSLRLGFLAGITLTRLLRFILLRRRLFLICLIAWPRLLVILIVLVLLLGLRQVLAKSWIVGGCILLVVRPLMIFLDATVILIACILSKPILLRLILIPSILTVGAFRCVLILLLILRLILGLIFLLLGSLKLLRWVVIILLILIILVPLSLFLIFATL